MVILPEYATRVCLNKLPKRSGQNPPLKGIRLGPIIAPL